MQHHLETFLATAEDEDARGWGIPSWVERDFRASCNTRRMAEVAAHLTDQVLARGPPQGDFLLDQSLEGDPTEAEPVPAFDFDQSGPEFDFDQSLQDPFDD